MTTSSWSRRWSTSTPGARARALALRLLGEWDRSHEQFVRVMPREYARALAEAAAEAGAGVNGAADASEVAA